jgi:hypothetical protein
MGRLADSTTRLTFPLDPNLAEPICSATHSFLRLCGLPRPASLFITRQILGAFRKRGDRSAARAVRGFLTLSSRAGKVRVALRLSGAGTGGLRLASLARGAPSGAEARYRPGRGGGTLTFSSAAARKG